MKRQIESTEDRVPRTYAYLRVSTDMQDVNSQRIGIEEFAKGREWEIDEWTLDEGVSGAKDPSKRKLGGLVRKCQKGDRLVFSEISRIGRKLDMILDIIRECSERGIMIYTVKDRYVLEDSIQSKVLVTVMGLAAEIERDLIRQRTKEGLKRARAAGKQIGHPVGKKNNHHKLDGKHEEICRMIGDGKTQTEIAKKLKVHSMTLYRYMKEHGLKKGDITA